MLRIESLKLVNFGPYYGEHTISFPKEDGVTIIWGENGYGKTSIMNSFRYVLWGTIINRKKKRLSPASFVNLNAVDENGNMLVEMCFQYNGDECILTRGLNRIGGDGSKDEDYESYCSMHQGARILTHDETEDLLASALPDKISRFYLFDGELLGEYEDLMDDEDDAGEKIKQSIEDILGLPILEHAKTNLDTIHTEFNKEATNIGKKDQSTAKLSDQLQKAQDLKDHLLQSRTELKQQLEELDEEHSAIEQRISCNVKLGGLAGQKKAKKEQLEKDQQAIEAAKNEISPYLGNAWRTILNSVITKEKDNLQKSIDSIKKKDDEHNTMLTVSAFIRSRLEQEPNHCPLCKDNIPKEDIERILKEFDPSNISTLTEEEIKELDNAQSGVQFLKGQLKEDQKQKISALLSTIDNKTIEINILKTGISQIEEDIKKISSSSSEEEILALPGLLSKCVKKIDEIKTGIQDNEEQITDNESAITKLTAQLKKNSNSPDLSEAIEKEQFASRLSSLFTDGINLFRNKLKQSVQKDASDFFCSISHDKEYTGLLINDNYGMHIMAENGKIAPNRSSGYEQVVAISLIAALHKNAPIEGPIFMDSTFQRVDGTHKINTLKSAPSFGKQIIILAYDKEIADHNEVRATLGSKLIREMRLIHPSSTKTTITD